MNKIIDNFYHGYNKTVALAPKLLVIALVLFVAIYPDSAGQKLLAAQNWSTETFGGWYIYVTLFYVICCLSLGLFNKTGKIKLGKENEHPEFTTLSWLSMMFGAGIGIGMLTYSTAEPIFHFANNPDTITGVSASLNENNVRNAYKWAIFHYALHSWCIYGIIGISLAYFSYNRGMPLTIRSGLEPIFGKFMSSGLGNMTDIVSILATLVGLGVTIGYGVSQFSSGLFNITGLEWLIDNEGRPSLTGQVFGLVLIMTISCVSAFTGIRKGIKWLSNINMGLSLLLLLFFVFFGATLFALKTFFITIWDYLISFPEMAISVWKNNGTETNSNLQKWQSAWSIFYWAWWIAFAPFVGLFLARVSRGRTIREYIMGAIFIPSLITLFWFAFVGGTPIDLELSGVAQGAIVNADISAQLFQTINLVMNPTMAILLSILVVILLITFLVTSADSGILVMNTLASGGNTKKRELKHIILWGLLFSVMIAVLLMAGGMDSLRSVMIIGALPFSLILALMPVALVKTILQKNN